MKLKFAAGLLALSLVTPAAMAQDMPFGSADDVAFATQLWDVLLAAKMVGPGMIRVFPYEGTMFFH